MSILSRILGTEPKSQTVQEQLAGTLAGLETELAEKVLESINLMANYVDPSERFRGPDGEFWIPLGGHREGESPTDTSNFTDEDQLTKARDYCRLLARKNPYAINIHENLISYVVGEGHKYTIVAKKDASVSEEAIKQAQEALDAWLEENRWCKRQQELVLRLDRDGEVFLRKFVGADGMTRLRFIEPYRIRQPAGNQQATWGIECDPDDVETPRTYHIAPLTTADEWDPVDASEIQHRKVNVDSNVKRGVPTTWAIGPVLERVARLMDNMGVIAEIQTAIAMIRRHLGGTKAGLENMRATKADYTKTSPTGKTEYYEKRKKGAIIDANANTEHEFPPAPDVTGWIEGASFNLRGAAARIPLPEFMLTSDASNANYSSTMIAESPAVRMFQRRQAAQKEADLEIIWEALERMADAQAFPADILESIDIQCEPPTVEVRDEKAEADTNKVYVDMGIMSKQTVSASIGLDYEQEQANIEQHDKEHPNQMQQAEIDVLKAKADPKALQQADKAARMEAVMAGVQESIEGYLGG
jgi:hypothetical protein